MALRLFRSVQHAPACRNDPPGDNSAGMGRLEVGAVGTALLAVGMHLVMSDGLRDFRLARGHRLPRRGYHRAKGEELKCGG
jgi:hypothetical protein